MTPKRMWASRDKNDNRIYLWREEPFYSPESGSGWLGEGHWPIGDVYSIEEFEQQYGYTIAEGLAVEMECHYRNLRIKEGGK